MGLISRLYMGFVDDTVNRLLCLESHKEAAIAIGTISREEREYTLSNDLLSGQLESRDRDRDSRNVHSKHSSSIKRR